MPLRPLLVRRADKNAGLPEPLQNQGHRAPECAGSGARNPRLRCAHILIERFCHF